MHSNVVFLQTHSLTNLLCMNRRKNEIEIESSFISLFLQSTLVAIENLKCFLTVFSISIGDFHSISLVLLRYFLSFLFVVSLRFQNSFFFDRFRWSFHLFAIFFQLLFQLSPKGEFLFMNKTFTSLLSINTHIHWAFAKKLGNKKGIWSTGKTSFRQWLQCNLIRCP